MVLSPRNNTRHSIILILVFALCPFTDKEKRNIYKEIDEWSNAMVNIIVEYTHVSTHIHTRYVSRIKNRARKIKEGKIECNEKKND